MRRGISIIATVLAVACTIATANAEEGTVQVAFYHPHAPQIVQTEAQRLFADVNVTRRMHGLAPLEPDDRLNGFALNVAREMAQHHYFGHTDPSGITFEERIKSSGIPFRTAEENMAFDQDEPHAHQAFLHSAGHYANIVDPGVHHLGIAVVAAGAGEVFYVEEFTD